MSRKTTHKAIKALCTSGKAVDLTGIKDAEMKRIYKVEQGFTALQTSHGVSGITGAILQGHKTGTIYGLHSRCNNLFIAL